MSYTETAPAPAEASPAPVHVEPRKKSRTLVLSGAVIVALISTYSAYLAMVGFGMDVFGMDAWTAYTTAGVFELSLITVALLAREAAQDNRPGGVLLALTWALSGASGVFAAWHEVYLGHPVGAVGFRFIVPLLAALMWHLALIGDRHLATGLSFDQIRKERRTARKLATAERRMLAYIVASEAVRDARRRGDRVGRVEALRRREARTRNRALKPEVQTVEEFDARYDAWTERLTHAEDRRRGLYLLGDLPVVDVEPAAVEAPAPDVEPEPEPLPAVAAAPAPRLLVAAPAPSDDVPAGARWEGLGKSEREHIVASMNLSGRTNAEIAATLSVSESTISRQVKKLREAGALPAAGTPTNPEGIPAVPAPEPIAV